MGPAPPHMAGLMIRENGNPAWVTIEAQTAAAAAAASKCVHCKGGPATVCEACAKVDHADIHKLVAEFAKLQAAGRVAHGGGSSGGGGGSSSGGGGSRGGGGGGSESSYHGSASGRTDHQPAGRVEMVDKGTQKGTHYHLWQTSLRVAGLTQHTADPHDEDHHATISVAEAHLERVRWWS